MPLFVQCSFHFNRKTYRVKLLSSSIRTRKLKWSFLGLFWWMANSACECECVLYLLSAIVQESQRAVICAHQEGFKLFASLHQMLNVVLKPGVQTKDPNKSDPHFIHTRFIIFMSSDLKCAAGFLLLSLSSSLILTFSPYFYLLYFLPLLSRLNSVWPIANSPIKISCWHSANNCSFYSLHRDNDHF